MQQTRTSILIDSQMMTREFIMSLAPLREIELYFLDRFLNPDISMHELLYVLILIGISITFVAADIS